MHLFHQNQLPTYISTHFSILAFNAQILLKDTGARTVRLSEKNHKLHSYFISTRLYLSYHTLYSGSKKHAYFEIGIKIFNVFKHYSQCVVVKYEAVFWEVAFEKRSI